MVKRFTAAVVMVLAALVFGTVAAHAATVSHTRLWWDGATCRAFAAGQVHVMVVDSRHADTFLRSDVAEFAHDARAGAPRSVIEMDRGYVALDCAGSYGL